MKAQEASGTCLHCHFFLLSHSPYRAGYFNETMCFDFWLNAASKLCFALKRLDLKAQNKRENVLQSFLTFILKLVLFYTKIKKHAIVTVFQLGPTNRQTQCLLALLSSCNRLQEGLVQICVQEDFLYLSKTKTGTARQHNFIVISSVSSYRVACWPLL